MAEGTDTSPVPIEDTEEVTPGYVAPKKVDLKTIQDLDQDDESLVKYKQQLLGQTQGVQDDGGPNVIVKQMVLAPEGRDELVLDLTGDLNDKEKMSIVVKDGCEYRIKVIFRVQREIVAGLRYAYSISRKGIRVDKGNLMVGSYGPKTEAHVFTTPKEEAPSGLLSRGTYTVKSMFTDDDKNVILQWQWTLEVKKDWA